MEIWVFRTLGKKLVLSAAEGMAAFLNFSPSGRDKSKGAGGGNPLFFAACQAPAA